MLVFTKVIQGIIKREHVLECRTRTVFILSNKPFTVLNLYLLKYMYAMKFDD